MAIGDYNRSTRECAFDQMHPNLVKGIRAYIQKHELGDIEAGILLCCETISEKKQKGFFASLVSTDPDPVHHTGMLVTPTWLIWARSGVKYGTVVSIVSPNILRVAPCREKALVNRFYLLV